ncbi:MAG TPA: single-stranded-DNA-specific exonuclease RecJ, partial [Candidatus Hydrogenedentes bacterium]|nr:single-stranded-DNA-specific exonuclease RecJ [Candidatus Hydrogenedentota bacterium]
LDDLSDPFDLQDMDKAVARIHRARDRGERILVFGDYDVDGIAGAAILTNALGRFGVRDCLTDLPHRLEEGYGLSIERVEAAALEGVSLIITVDNGINARGATEAAAQRGIDVVITDHHQIEGDLPRAEALVNPVRHQPPGPLAGASGAAVAFQLARALNGGQHEVDLVALGTVADVISLRGENRILVAAGLDVLRRNPRPGIAALASVAHVDVAALTAEHIAFQLAPRMNAAGRLDRADISLQLLLAEDPGEARRLAGELDRANEERRAVERAILADAREELDTVLRPEQRSIVLARRGWHAGVIGIVAAHLYRAYGRPVVLISVGEDGVGRGSARCAPGFGMVEAMSACAQHLVQFGGHDAAAGLTVHEKHIDAFQRAFEAEAARRLPAGEARAALDVDALVSLSDIDGQLTRTLDRLRPFGHGNPAPVFCSYGVSCLPDSVRELSGGHLKFAVRQGARVLDVIGWRMGGRLTAAQAAAAHLDLAYTPQLDTWRGETRIQLVLKDMCTSVA